MATNITTSAKSILQWPVFMMRVLKCLSRQNFLGQSFFPRSMWYLNKCPRNTFQSHFTFVLLHQSTLGIYQFLLFINEPYHGQLIQCSYHLHSLSQHPVTSVNTCRKIRLKYCQIILTIVYCMWSSWCDLPSHFVLLIVAVLLQSYPPCKHGQTNGSSILSIQQK